MASFETDELQSSGSTDRPYEDSDSSYNPYSQYSQNFDSETFDSGDEHNPRRYLVEYPKLLSLFRYQ